MLKGIWIRLKSLFTGPAPDMNRTLQKRLLRNKMKQKQYLSKRK